MLMIPVLKVDNVQKLMNNISREVEILTKNKKEMVETKVTIKIMKNSFTKLIRRLDTTEKKINELEDILIETLKI